MKFTEEKLEKADIMFNEEGSNELNN